MIFLFSIFILVGKDVKKGVLMVVKGVSSILQNDIYSYIVVQIKPLCSVIKRKAAVWKLQPSAG